MKCIEFRELSLSDPNSSEQNFVEHSKDCPDCLKYVTEVRQMDADLADSLQVAVPSDLVARLQFNQELSANDSQGWFGMPKMAIAASFAVALFVGGFILSNQFSMNNSISEDYESLLAGVVEHMHEQQFTPVWEAGRANKTVNTLLSSYDSSLKLRDLPNLQFSRVCPMGQYRGLHATMQTDNGQITFAYIKGDSVGDLLDTAYKGYVTRIKPVQGGTLIIVSRNKGSLDQAEQELDQAMYWDI